MVLNVASCPACHALVNRRWTACIVCRTPLVCEQAEREPIPGGCWWCGSRRFWLSIYDQLICGRCHPPMEQALIKEWVE